MPAFIPDLPVILAFALAAFVLAIVGLLVSGGVIGGGGEAPARVSFQIATGSTAGTYFPVGQAMAGLLSHPPGVGRCETATVCGPSGVIISARTSPGAASNLMMVDQGQVDSGLVQGDVIAAAAEVNIDQAEVIPETVRGPDGIRDTDDDVPFRDAQTALGLLRIDVNSRPDIAARFSASDTTVRIESTGVAERAKRRVNVILRNRSGRPVRDRPRRRAGQ